MLGLHALQERMAATMNEVEFAMRRAPFRSVTMLANGLLRRSRSAPLSADEAKGAVPTSRLPRLA